MTPDPILRFLGRVDYQPAWRAMQDFTARRDADAADEIWLLEHPPVFTLGMAGKREHVLADIGIPVLAIDRGGQVTYHGPGQVVGYLLVDLRRRGYGVRELVHRMEQAVIDVLAEHGLAGERLAGAPGVYVASGGEGGLAKLAALGLRVRHGCTYHGLALNVDLDLAPYRAINPCGYAGMAVTRLKDFVPEVGREAVEAALARRLLERVYGEKSDGVTA
jgi:lipoyl(octanoyl) transferase